MRNKVISDMADVIYNNTNQSDKGSAIIAVQVWEKIKDRVAIVDREAELPNPDILKVVNEIKSPHWLTLREKIGFDIIVALTQQAIRKAGWVKEYN